MYQRQEYSKARPMKTVRFRGTQVKFLPACVYCLHTARGKDSTYNIERTFIYGRRAVLLRLPVPICSEHLRKARAKSRAQVRCERIGLAVAIVLGLAACGELLYYWSAIGQGKWFFNLPIAAITGMCFFGTVWAVSYLSIAPVFASAETKEIRNSVRLKKYDPCRQVLEVAFANDAVAELTRRNNYSILAEDLSGFKKYRLMAGIQSSDIRLNGEAKTYVMLDHIPDEKEAMDLLQPAIDMEMATQLGDGCFYDTYFISAEEIPENI
jgi:hypothetical protein